MKQQRLREGSSPSASGLPALLFCLGRSRRPGGAIGRGPRAREGMEDGEEEAQQPLLESEVGVRLVEEEERGTPAQRPEPMDGSG